MDFDLAYFRLARAIRNGKECFLCTLENEIESKYIETYLSELVMDVSSRQKIIESRGFCNNHFYKMLIAASKPGSSDGHGIALVNESIIEKLMQDLQRQKGYHINDFDKLLATERKCPVCVHLSHFARMYAEKLIEILSSNNEEFLDLLKGSKGFCFPHFIALVYTAKEVMPTQNQKIIKTIIEIEEKNFCRLNSELAEYIKSQSYEFSEKDRLIVADAVSRSVEKIVGRRGMKLETIEKAKRWKHV